MKKYFLPLIFIFFVYSETGEVEFQDLIKIDSNHYEVNFVLENTALILSESSNDPFGYSFLYFLEKILKQCKER